MTDTFVHGEIEVRKTGREAQKDMPGGKQKMILVEITPANEYDGSWKKWVNPQTLFAIINPDNK
jgi:hypothetical protein